MHVRLICAIKFYLLTYLLKMRVLGQFVTLCVYRPESYARDSTRTQARRPIPSARTGEPRRSGRSDRDADWGVDSDAPKERRSIEGVQISERREAVLREDDVRIFRPIPSARPPPPNDVKVKVNGEQQLATSLTATGPHMPYGITVLPAIRGRGDTPAVVEGVQVSEQR